MKFAGSSASAAERTGRKLRHFLLLAAEGDHIWARALAGGSYGEGYGIAKDGAGNVYATGNFQGTVDFDPGPEAFELTSAGSSDVLVS